jgi:glycosyltransferase involved in cell wall biosynthesis
MARDYGLAPYTTVLNGVATGVYATSRIGRDAWRTSQGFRDETIFVCVARLEAQKNHRLLLSAFNTVAGRCPAARLLIAGDGSLRSDLEQLAVRLGLSERVRFLGERTDIPEILHASDVFVLASNWEGHSVAVIEAMAAGLPVVATDVGGTVETIEHGSDGLLVPAGDKRRFADALSELALSVERRKALGAGASLHARRFSVDRMVTEYLALYNTLLCSQRR